MKVLSLLMLVFLIVSCKSSSDKYVDQLVIEYKAHMQKSKDFKAALEAHYGQEFTVVRDIETKKNYTVYQNKSTGEFVAYHLAKWDGGMTIESYNEIATVNVDIVRNLQETVEERTYYDDYGDRRTAYDTYYVGSGFKFDNTSIPSKDLETLASLKEEAMGAYLRHQFESEFSLSSQRAEELSRLAMRYKKLESTRELTSSEKDIFAMKALGVSLSQIESAMKKKAEGEESQYKKLLDTAAKVNRSTPEQIGKFFEVMENNL